MDQDLCARVADIRRRLDAAALARWGRAPEIIAVSKTVSAPRINEVKAAGIAAYRKRWKNCRIWTQLFKLISSDGCKSTRLNI